MGAPPWDEYDQMSSQAGYAKPDSPASADTPRVEDAPPIATQQETSPLKETDGDVTEKVVGPPKTANVIAAASDDNEWYNIVQSLPLSGLSAELAKHCILAKQDEQRIELHLGQDSEMLHSSEVADEIEAALTEHFGRQRKLVLVIREALSEETPAQYDARYRRECQLAAEQNIHNDRFVLALAERFDAKVVPGSVVPNTE